MRKISLARPYFTEDEITEVRKTIQSRWVAQGPRVQEFERKYAEYCGAKHGIAVNSCTSGLHLALLSLGISEGDKVIIPDFTFMATGNVVLHVGARPVLVDIELDTFCIDVEAIEDKIDDAVKAIIPVHTFGHPANMEKLNDIARKYGLKIIEDAASGMGSEIKGNKIGSFGNISSFSLQARKVITTGEGGIIIVNDDALSENLRALRSQGLFSAKTTDFQHGVKLPIFRRLGFSYRLSDIQASIGLVQLERIEEFIKQRIYLAGQYRDLLEDAKLDVITPEPSDKIRHTYQAYVVLLNGNNRDKVIAKLKEKGVESNIGTYSLSSMPLFRSEENLCPRGDNAYKNSLALPMFHELTEQEINYVVHNLKEIIKT
jgi:dTDP-4-amino-4,6-dideoxygalactose transaminase